MPGWRVRRPIHSGLAADSGRFGLDVAQGQQGLQGFRMFLQGPVQPVPRAKPGQYQFEEGLELDVGHRKAVQGAVGGVAQFEPGPGQGREHGVDVEVVALGGAGLAGGQPQVLLDVAEVELDLEAVAVDAVDLLRCHLRVRTEEDCRSVFRRVGAGLQDEDHLQQLLEGLVVQLRVVQPLVLARQRSVRYYISSRPVDAEALLDLARGHWGVENGLHRTLDMQFREDDCCLRRSYAPAVMAILRRATLNMVKTFQQQFEPDLSIGLQRDRIGRQPWILAPILA